MFQMGSQQDSLLLILLFTGWVSSPFAAQVGAYAMSNAWSSPALKGLHSIMIALTLVSVLCYSGLVSLPEARPSFMFLLVPLGSWLVMGLTFLLIRRQMF